METIMKCRICGEGTNIDFNIDFKPVAICENCAGAITKQNVISLINSTKH